MGRMLERTWVSTLVFVAVSVLISARFLGGMWTIGVGVCALVVSPLLWWTLVGTMTRPGIGRGAAAGALTLSTAQIIPVLLAIGWFTALRGHQGEAGLGAFGDALSTVIMLGIALLAAVVGAALGAILVRVTRAPAASS
jgi:hypothetical protein